jgi:hypothetical protein
MSLLLPEKSSAPIQLGPGEVLSPDSPQGVLPAAPRFTLDKSGNPRVQFLTSPATDQVAAPSANPNSAQAAFQSAPAKSSLLDGIREHELLSKTQDQLEGQQGDDAAQKFIDDWMAAHNQQAPGARKFSLSPTAASNPVTDAISQATAQGQAVLPPEETSLRTFSPNGSGESPASMEAINRVASENSQGIKRFRIDTRSGQETPLFGVDAVDVKAGPYDRIVQRGPMGETTLDQGARARMPAATPKVATNANLEDVLQRATKGLRTFSAKAGDD